MAATTVRESADQVEIIVEVCDRCEQPCSVDDSYSLCCNEPIEFVSMFVRAGDHI